MTARSTFTQIDLKALRQNAWVTLLANTQGSEESFISTELFKALTKPAINHRLEELGMKRDILPTKGELRTIKETLISPTSEQTYILDHLTAVVERVDNQLLRERDRLQSYFTSQHSQGGWTHGHNRSGRMASFPVDHLSADGKQRLLDELKAKGFSVTERFSETVGSNVVTVFEAGSPQFELLPNLTLPRLAGTAPLPLETETAINGGYPPGSPGSTEVALAETHGNHISAVNHGTDSSSLDGANANAGSEALAEVASNTSHEAESIERSAAGGGHVFPPSSPPHTPVGSAPGVGYAAERCESGIVSRAEASVEKLGCRGNRTAMIVAGATAAALGGWALYERMRRYDSKEHNERQ